MAAQVIPMVRINKGENSGGWECRFPDLMSTRLDGMQAGYAMNSLSDITSAIMAERSEIFGELPLDLVRKRFGHLMEQDCGKHLCSAFLQQQAFHHIRTEADEAGLSQSCEANLHYDPLVAQTCHAAGLRHGQTRRVSHIGSGAIESGNKLVSHVRLKRSGAWWYPSKANNILNLRCAKTHGTFDRVVKLYEKRNVARCAQTSESQDSNPGK